MGRLEALRKLRNRKRDEGIGRDCAENIERRRERAAVQSIFKFGKTPEVEMTDEIQILYLDYASLIVSRFIGARVSILNFL
jgi:hypothetical protein